MTTPETIAPGTAPTTALTRLNVLAKHRPIGTAHHMPRLGDPYTTINCACQPPRDPFMTSDAYVRHVFDALTEAEAAPPGHVVRPASIRRQYAPVDRDGECWPVYQTTDLEQLRQFISGPGPREGWTIVTRVSHDRGASVTDWEPLP